LAVHVDKQMRIARWFGVKGMPATFIVDRNGAVRGVLTGPAEWDSKEAKALIRYYLDEAGRG
ncbi:MAG TPA: TlpA family protein disulfide reductase, partial [Alphaproteobacteria bacterium]|nr:TlpA family protein disulfide reductase [Alphaproteobacteria bacterium]